MITESLTLEHCCFSFNENGNSYKMQVLLTNIQISTASSIWTQQNATHRVASKVPSVPVLGDLSNTISLLSSQKRKRKLSDDGKYVEASLRRLSDEEADRKILNIMAIFANVSISENLDYRYSPAPAYQHQIASCSTLCILYLT
ncbi:unnamed protein product [Cylicocyclus nassatus]|uniref:Uncharacterized protein n=1 Tax=Cylicocyclus nassatus TaxID=53992 RepID=A0AA36GCW8_CYLNA|nr:unnamed protein product [Cylicocyclus nassatus]